MPFNETLSASINTYRILKYPAPGAPRKPVVLDANDAVAFPDPGKNVRFLVPAGTILADSTVPGKQTKYDGSNGPIYGVLVNPVDIVANTTGGYEPAAAFFSDVHFATEKIVDFTLYSSDLVSDLSHATFE